MKLLGKLNAIVLLTCLATFLCSETDLNNQAERKKKMSMYDANDKLLNEVESQKLNSREPELAHQTFLENKAEKMSSNLIIVHGENPKLNISSEFIDEQKCEFKKGFLEIVDRDEGKRIITQKIRVILDKESLKMYTTMNENSLFATIQLDNILKISQDKKFFTTNCFDLVTNLAEDKVLHKSRLTLCTEKLLEMDQWIHFILELKECKVNQKYKNSQVVLDFNEINKIKNNQESIMKSTDEDLGLWYDNTKNNYSNTSISVKDRIIHQTVKNLIKNIQANEVMESKLKRTLNDQLKDARKFTNQLEQKNVIVNDLINKKIEKQMNSNLKFVNIKAADKEVQLIKAMAAKISDMKVNFFNLERPTKKRKKGKVRRNQKRKD